MQVIVSVTPFLDEIIVDHNPEMADMGNPDGAIFEKRLFIAAVTPSGRRYIHGRASFDRDEEARAERFAARIAAAGEIDLQHWCETYEVYGSPAWVAGDAEREAAHQSNPTTRGTVRDF